MERFKSLREVCIDLGISRRTVQGYEKKGLIMATARNKYGHLLYDQDAVRRIAFIRFLQKSGFSISEISNFIDSSLEDIKDRLNSHLANLRRELSNLDDMISYIEKLNCLKDRSAYLEEIFTMMKGGKEQ